MVAGHPRGYGTGTSRIVTGPSVGSSSVAWLVPAGAVTSIALGAVPGSMLQIGETPPTGHRPKSNGCGVGANPRAWSGLKPFWPCRTTEKTHPLVGWPSADAGTAIVIALDVEFALTPIVPRLFPPLSTNTGPAKPCTSIRSDHAESAAIV